MFDRDLVTSGFDTETVVSERYLTYILLAQIEAGLLPTTFPIDDGANDLTVRLHPPTDYQRTYTPEPTAELPPAALQSFTVELQRGNESAIDTIRFTPDGLEMRSHSVDATVRFWDVEGRAEIVASAFEAPAALASAFDSTGDRLVTGAPDRRVRIIDTQSGLVVSTLAGHTSAVTSVAFSRDGTLAASGSFNGEVRIWDLQAGTELHLLTGHNEIVHGLAFNHDGSRLASAAADRTVRVWDVVAGSEALLLEGHAGAVNDVAFSPDGTALASAGDDKSVRLWDPISGDEDANLQGHEAKVTSVAYNNTGSRVASGDRDGRVIVWSTVSESAVRGINAHEQQVLDMAFSPDGTQLATSSADARIRIWDPASGAELTVLSIDFMELRVQTSVVDNVTGQQVAELNVELIVNIELLADREGGLERNHRWRVSLGRLGDATRALLEVFGIDPDDAERILRAQLGRTIPLSLAQGEQVQQIRMKKFVDGSKRSLGLYVDLALKSGPEDGAYVEPRGTLALAQDFREPDTHVAFATSPGLFALLGPDAKFRQAEETSPGSGDFRFPLRENPLDDESDEVGKIKSIDIGPELVAQTTNTPPAPTGRLQIDVHGEYTDAPGDPDFHLLLLFDPKLKDGLVEFDLDVRVNLGLLATLVLVAGAIGLTLLFAPSLAWTSSILIGTFVGLAVLRGLIAEPLAAKIIEDRIDEDGQASFLDALPFRLPAATRRWDPFYDTLHQIAAVFEDRWIIDQQGIAFAGVDLTLAKAPHPVEHVVIRDEQRIDGAVSALRYRVRDFVRNQTNLEANGPGLDRRDFSHADPDNEPELVDLTPQQVVDRKAEDRIRAPITYTAERIHVVGNQIDQLLCLSRTERGEERDRLIREFRARVRADIIADEGDDIRDDVTDALEQALGRPPTTQEINEAFEDAIDARFEEAIVVEQPPFEENELPDLLEEAIAQILRFDLAPEEFAELQTSGILVIDGKEIITRGNADGTVTTYYRDRPDFDPTDNLLALPHYIPPYTPPE